MRDVRVGQNHSFFSSRRAAGKKQVGDIFRPAYRIQKIGAFRLTVQCAQILARHGQGHVRRRQRGASPTLFRQPSHGLRRRVGIDRNGNRASGVDSEVARR